MNRLLILLLLVVFSTSFAKIPKPKEQPIRAVDMPRVLIIVDGSGSMKTITADGTKIANVKKAITSVLPDFKNSINLGLMAFGHRNQASCKDVEIMFPLTEMNIKLLTKQLNKITPSGKSPLSYALVKAYKTLDASQKPGTIILIADGKETCPHNPCATMKRLRQMNKNVTVNVIGYSVDENSEQQLQCVADLSKGMYLGINNKKELTTALKKITKKINTQTPQYNLKLSARIKSKKDNINKNINWIIYNTDKKVNGKYQFVTDSEKTTPKFNLPKGRYLVVMKYHNLKQEIHIVINGNTTIKKNIVLAIGTVKLSARLTAKNKIITRNIRWWVEDPVADYRGKHKQLYYSVDPSPTFLLKSGDYTIRVKYGNAVKTQRIRISNGDKKNATINMNAGILRLSAVPEAGANPYKKMKWWILSPSGKKRIAFLKTAAPAVVLTAGDYQIVAQNKTKRKQVSLSLPAGETTEFTLAFDE